MNHSDFVIRHSFVVRVWVIRNYFEIIMDTAIKVPLSERINLRMIIFVGVIAVLVGYPVYILVAAQLNGGIKDLGNGYKQVDLKAMSTFTFDQANGTLDDIPKQWRDLNGQKVVLYGEIWSPYEANNQIAGFDLCYSIAKCCFAGPPPGQHFFQSRVPQGKSVDYYQGKVKVTGVLHISVHKAGGKVNSIYQLEVASVEPVQ